MLQWMGGSRRKVNTSRKSTQKRQQQYFEQRRRQQQHQQGAADGGNYYEGKKAYDQQNENNRSLDILSLLNLSAAAQEQKPSHRIARERLEDDTLGCETLQQLPEAQSNEVKGQEHSKIKEARTSSCQQMGIGFPKTTSVTAPGNHVETLKKDYDRMNQLKMAPDCQLSVIDILEDDEPITNGKSLPNEAHVAFSIEGLGKVETETPVHSPEAHSRSFLHGCSSPSKAVKTTNSSKDLMSEMVNLEVELDAMMQDIDLPFCKSSVEQPFYSKKRVDSSFSKPKQRLAFEEFSPLNDSNNKLDDLLGDDELFYGSKDRNKAIWNGSQILADDILYESDFHLSDKNWMDSTCKSTEFANSMDYRKKRFTFEGLEQQERRTTMRKACELDCTESPVPKFKYQKLENLSNFTVPDMTWHSTIGRDHDFEDLKDELRESCFITEDERESLSLPSEESSSSIAVRGKLEGTLLNLKNKQAMRDTDDICHSENVYSEEISPGQRNRDKWNTTLKGHLNEPGMFARMSNRSGSTQVPQLHSTPKKSLKPDQGRYFEAEYDLEEQTSGCNSFSETSGVKKHVSSGCGLWTEDLFHASQNVDLGSSKSCFGRFNMSSSKCCPCCNLTEETHDYCEPNLKNVSGSSIRNIFQVSPQRHKPLDAHGCLTPKKESIVGHAEENSGIQVSDSGKFQPQGDEFIGSESSSVKSTYASDSEGEYRDRKAPTCQTANMGEEENKMNCFLQAENMTSLGPPNRVDGKQRNADGKCQFAPASHLCQTGFEELEDPRPKQRTIGSEVQRTADSTRQVRMFDSCIMQLLCVQVLKGVSMKVTGEQPYQ